MFNQNKDPSSCNRDTMITIAKKLKTFGIFFHLASVLLTDIEIPLLILVASMFFASPSYISIFSTPSCQEKSNQSLAIVYPYSWQSSPASRSQPSIRKRADGVQKVLFVYSSQITSTHSE